MTIKINIDFTAMNKPFFFYALLIAIAFSSCNGTKTPEQSKQESTRKDLQLIRIVSPINGDIISLGDEITFELKLLNDTLKPDSIVLFVDNARVGKTDELRQIVSSESLSLGSKQLRATAWLGSARQTASVGIKVKSNVAPKQLKYKVINTYPHHIDAYTQGLFFHNGQLIESTGQKGFSSLRRVDLKTGKVLQSINLDRKYFGEGATYINGEIFQITWTSRKGFVYNPETFDLIRTFDYQTQGWGLTTIDDMLVMSDGSNILYFLEPKSFSEIKRVEVYNDKGPVNQLNELEYIKGRIYANVYQSDKIVIINPHTGVVEAEVNFSGLLSNSDKHSNIDVFNGIAWDEKTQRLFVTGKNWPKLFQVELY
jgi:glutamine cyclotransferase